MQLLLREHTPHNDSNIRTVACPLHNLWQETTDYHTPEWSLRRLLKFSEVYIQQMSYWRFEFCFLSLPVPDNSWTFAAAQYQLHLLF